MKCILLPLTCISLFAPQSIIALASRTAPQENQSRQEAERLWEQAIVAKGGRERLQAIRNVVISTGGSYTPLRFKIKPGGEVTSRSMNRSGISREELYVFPSKFWLWDDYRPAVFGLWVKRYNFETKMKQVITDGEPNHPPEAISDDELASRKELPFSQLIYLLESKWITPKPLKVNPERIGLQVFDVVQTEIEGRRVDFAMDRKTHLPVRITTYDEFRGKVYPNVLRLSEYAAIDGIKVPLTLEMSDGHKEKSIVKFNVEYNEEIFTKPLSIEAGPEAWMKSKNLR
jgi:hypothetical protein